MNGTNKPIASRVTKFVRFTNRIDTCAFINNNPHYNILSITCDNGEYTVFYQELIVNKYY
jgi:predicted nucleic-acid-binding Zn-ribbon protein